MGRKFFTRLVLIFVFGTSGISWSQTISINEDYTETSIVTGNGSETLTVKSISAWGPPTVTFIGIEDYTDFIVGDGIKPITVILNAANTYSGTTTVHQYATLEQRPQGAIIPGAIVLSAGTLQLDISGWGEGTFGNAISLSGGGSLQTSGMGSYLFNVNISGGGGLTISGGTINLNYSCSYTGGTTIASGATLGADAATIPASESDGITISGGTVNFTGGSSYTGPITLDNDEGGHSNVITANGLGKFTLSGDLTGSEGLSVGDGSNATNIELTATGNNYSEATVVNTNSIFQGTPTALGSLPINLNGGTLQYNVTDQESPGNPIILIGNGIISTNGGGSVILGKINQIGASSLTIGGGTVQLSNSNNGYTGGTIVLSGATVQAGILGIPNHPITLSGGTVEINPGNPSGQTLPHHIILNGSGVVNSKTSPSAPLTLSGIISEVGGASSMTFAGGAVKLTNSSNNYTGGTIVSSGTTLQGIASSEGRTIPVAASGPSLQLNGGTFSPQDTSAATYEGKIALTGANTILFNEASSNVLTLSGEIGGAGSLTIGDGSTETNLSLTGKNKYSGGTTVTSNSRVSVGMSDIMGSIGGTGLVSFTDTESNTYSGDLNLTGTLSAGAAGATLTFSGNNNVNIVSALGGSLVFNNLANEFSQINFSLMGDARVSVTIPSTSIGTGGSSIDFGGGTPTLILTGNTPATWSNINLSST